MNVCRTEEERSVGGGMFYLVQVCLFFPDKMTQLLYRGTNFGMLPSQRLVEVSEVFKHKILSEPLEPIDLYRKGVTVEAAKQFKIFLMSDEDADPLVNLTGWLLDTPTLVGVGVLVDTFKVMGELKQSVISQLADPNSILFCEV